MSNLYEAHTQWRNRPQDQRFETLSDLRDFVSNRRMRSRSADVEVIDLSARVTQGSDGKDALVFSAPKMIVEPSHWSFGQLSGFIGAPPAYLRTLPNQLAVENINHGIKVTRGEKPLKLMAISPDDGDLSTLQAVTSTTYGRIWDADVADGVQRVVEKSGGRFFNPKAMVGGQVRPSGLYASDHDIFVFMVDGGSLLDAGPRAQLSRGFFAWNSETGAKSFGLTTFLFNAVCGNHIVWGAEDVSKILIRHSSGGPTRFDTEAVPLLLSYVNASAKPLEEAVARASGAVLSDKVAENDTELFKQVATYASRYAKFTNGELKSAIDFAKSEEGECRTVWQLIQGLTAYARGFDYVDSRVDLETRAGKLMTPFNN